MVLIPQVSADNISDPEHPYTLEQLKVIDEKSITVRS